MPSLVKKIYYFVPTGNIISTVQCRGPATVCGAWPAADGESLTFEAQGSTTPLQRVGEIHRSC